MDESIVRLDVVVAGFGSPHGDDQAGWHVIAKLARHEGLAARILTIREGTQLVCELEGCRTLIVIDACRSTSPVGTITRFCWPDPRIRQHHNHSTHGIGLCNALELAGQLGRIPPEVDVFGIEISGPNPLAELSCEVQWAVDELAEIILAELCESAHA
jgi:hydrogenase maturation protease